jgi:NADPH-dependent curcumin reductase CurA
MVLNKSLILIDHLDEGMPGPEHFRIDEQDFDVESTQQSLPANSLLLQALVASADPYMRGVIKSTGSMKPGDVVGGFIAGKVLASTIPDWNAGDFFGAHLPIKTYQIVEQKVISATMMWKLTSFLTEENISLGVGVLGMPGSTAYGGLIDILRPNEGETIFISAASGAVGGLVGMIAKAIYNCQVIGSCGGPEKCELIKSYYGFDHAIDYKQATKTEDLVAMIKAVAPQGIDMYFENVGGMHFEAAMEVLRPRGRVAVCGMISDYNAKGVATQIFYPMKMIYTQQRIEGFLCQDWLTGRKGNFLPDMRRWLDEGKVKVQETFFDGMESWPMAFQSLFTGKNVGKVVVRL